jgi:N-carbamoyl-L-amino-acid hydrolase
VTVEATLDTVEAASVSSVRQSFERRFDALAAIGRDARTGAYRRFSWTKEDLEARAWFIAEAQALGLLAEVDRFGNLWAWWGDPNGPGAIVTGSHLDTVPGGGAFDGALGVVAALGAIELLRDADVAPTAPVAAVVFTEEEGARFGLATLGSRLAAGVVVADEVLARQDEAGVTLATAMRSAHLYPSAHRSTPNPIDRAACFIELHIEQGRRLVDLDTPIGVATEIVPHGRWRMSATGQGNHAGTTRLEDRHDPGLCLAEAITSARRQAAAIDAVATIGRVEVHPNGSNVIPSEALAWLDARAPDEDALSTLVQGWTDDLAVVAAATGCRITVTEESRSAPVTFDSVLTGRIRRVLQAEHAVVPAIATGAGHDAGILASVVPAAMLFVRNPTGISHAADEAASVEDCVLGIEGLAAVIEDLLVRPLVWQA